MPWKLIGKQKTVRVTRNLANKFASMEGAPGDRPLSERRLLVYQRALNEGRFRPVEWATAHCKETGGTYRVNGKHTSTMLSGLAKIPEFYATIQEYECPTLQDVANLYSTFDSSVQSRSARDIYLSFASTVPELRDVNPRIIATAITGMAMHLAGGDRHGGRQYEQAADKAELLLEYTEFVSWYAQMVSAGLTGNQRGRDGRHKAVHMIRQPVAAAMMGTYLRARGPATQFWCAVRDETGDKNDLPDRVLARFLHDVSLHADSGRKVDAKFCNPRAIYAKCLVAWNAWRESRKTDLKYYENKPVPEAV